MFKKWLGSFLFVTGACALAAGAQPADRPATVPDPAEEVLGMAEWVLDNAQIVKYERLDRPAREQVRMLKGGICQARTDSSGFVSFALRMAARKHYEVIEPLESPYPQARTYVDFFNRLKGGNSNGWHRIDNYKDLKAGDILACSNNRSDGSGEAHDGHMMIIAAPPSAVTLETIDGSGVRSADVSVFDSSPTSHFEPETLPPLAQQPRRDGVGKAHIKLLLNGRDQMIGVWFSPTTEPAYLGSVQNGRNGHSVLEFGRLLPDQS